MDRKPYAGSTPKLVLAYDVGTTFSGAAYCLLDPNEVPRVQGVMEYNGQGVSKIPTIVYYDDSGTARPHDEEEISEQIEQLAEDNGWRKAEWFKLHLRPKTTSSAGVTDKIPPLPKGKTVVQVFADFLRYLHHCTRKFIIRSNLDGADMWKRLEPTIEYVLSHPNGWEGGQQDLMRKAAILAGFIPDTEAGRSRLFFVTEGEASLHFCIEKGLAEKATADDSGILIVDAGGGTIDISAYKQTSPDAQSYEEIAPAKCAFNGSVFVTKKAEEHLEKLLNGSQFEGDIPCITKTFDEKTKIAFYSPDVSHFIRFGRLKDNDKDLDVKSGQLRLSGPVVAGFFEPSISAITTIVQDQCKAAKEEISSVFIVGGFAANRWLYENLKKRLEPNGLYVCRPPDANKAVASGAVSYHIDHRVSSRVAKNFYGTGAEFLYRAWDPEHISRCNSMYIGVDGNKWISGRFDVVLSRGTKVTETQEFRESYIRNSKRKSDPFLNIIRDDIRCYRGLREYPKWFDEEPNMYSILCYVEADLSHAPKNTKTSLDKGRYYQINYDVVLSLGLTEIKAYIAWKENGVEKRSSAQLVYDPDVIIDDIPIIPELDGRV